MNKFYQDLFDVLPGCRSIGKSKRESKAASMETRINNAQVILNFSIQRTWLSSKKKKGNYRTLTA